MSQKKSKGKPKSRAKKKKASRKLPWLKIVVCLVVFLGVFVYLRGRYGTVSPPMDSLKKTYRADTTAVDLYYADPELDGLKAEQRDIASLSSLSEKISQTLIDLIRGPEGNLINAIPENTRLLNVRIDDDGVVWVNFSSHLSSAHPGGSSAEIITVYSIVNTILLNFNEVKSVRILIDGAKVDTLAGHIDCTKPFVADRGLIH
jgi:flagellar basal body-associated protein FliL